MTRRTATLYKFLGGLFTVLGLPAAILVVLRDTPPGGGPSAPLYEAILPAVIGVMGLAIFVSADRVRRRLEKMERQRSRSGTDTNPRDKR